MQERSGNFAYFSSVPLPQEPAAVFAAALLSFWPRGLLAQVRAECNRSGTFLIADEVLTGFGRT